jgi:hypothetical protein
VTCCEFERAALTSLITPDAYAGSQREEPVIATKNANQKVGQSTLAEQGVDSVPHRSRIELVTVLVLLVLDLAAGAVLAYLAVVLVVAYDTCIVQECSYNGFMAGWLLALLGPPIVLVIAATASIVHLVRRRRAWWIPLVGLALAVAIWWAGAQLVFVAVPGSSF